MRKKKNRWGNYNQGKKKKKKGPDHIFASKQARMSSEVVDIPVEQYLKEKEDAAG